MCFSAKSEAVGLEADLRLEAWRGELEAWQASESMVHRRPSGHMSGQGAALQAQPIYQADGNMAVCLCSQFLDPYPSPQAHWR